MNKFVSRLLSGIAAVTCVFAMMAPAAMAATVDEATIDATKTGSITIYKIDHTNAVEDGAWDDTYESTGVEDKEGVNDVLVEHPIEGVEFSYLKVADIFTYTEVENGQAYLSTLYGFDPASELLTILNLDEVHPYPPSNETVSYYPSNLLNKAMRDAMAADPTGTKNALEAYILANRGNDATVGGAMDLTDATGKTSVSGLELGLYLLVETLVPENVSNTTSFFVSLPMTSVDGTNATDGGHRWIYDVVVYPKNDTAVVDLKKEVRESKEDGGKHNGTLTDIHDGYAHTATASTGDVVEYQIISTLPTITSAATNISTYTFVDTLSKGITYNKRTAEGTDGVLVEWFSDKECTNKVAEWTQESGKFAVAYTAGANDTEVMTITMTESGLAEINTAAGSAANINNSGNMTYAGYSNYTIRITYSATLNSDAEFVYGSDGNPNTVTLTWKRTSENYYDTLTDDAHVYSYGIDLTKQFSGTNNVTAETEGMYDHVKFVVRNLTDGSFIKAELNAAEGIYYVTGYAATEEEATKFEPVKKDDRYGRIVIKGLEDDSYEITETETANGFTLLEDSIIVNITVVETEGSCEVNLNEHKPLNAQATVNGKTVTMLEDGSSINALAPLTVLNSPGIDVPETGDTSLVLLTTCGSLIVVCGSIMLVMFLCKNKKKEQ